ncbi:MAG: RNA 3'-terminal phosphate cyclase [Hyphomicrobiaceae bacterium]
MIKIDGSEGEGGGQILRSALTLSALTGQPFTIEKIRAGRAKPGLLRQHMTALRAAAAICGGKYSDGIGIGSTELMFYPGDVRAGSYDFAVGTAGSAMLVLQTILLPLLQADEASRVTISGGTHNPAAPPYEFVAQCFLPLLREMGADVEAKLIEFGFMPAGGGKVMATIQPCDALKPIDVLERGEMSDLVAEAYFANIPFDVAERELGRLSQRLSLPEASTKVREVRSVGPGNMLAVTARNARLTEMITGFGQRGVRAEAIADDVADRTNAYLESKVAVGPHLADQLLLPLALAGGGSFTTSEPTPHTKTNAMTIAKFLDSDIVFEPFGTTGDITVTVTRK